MKKLKHLGIKSGNKYKAVKTNVNGHRFDSKAEAEYYLYLKSINAHIVELQPKIYLTEARILMKPDFLLSEQGRLIYIDVKGMMTPVFKIKARLFKHYGHGTLRLVKKSGKSFKIIDEIISI